jgi:hypothetical protein
MTSKSWKRLLDKGTTKKLMTKAGILKMLPKNLSAFAGHARTLRHGGTDDDALWESLYDSLYGTRNHLARPFEGITLRAGLRFGCIKDPYRTLKRCVNAKTTKAMLNIRDASVAEIVILSAAPETIPGVKSSQGWVGMLTVDTLPIPQVVALFPTENALLAFSPGSDEWQHHRFAKEDADDDVPFIYLA